MPFFGYSPFFKKIDVLCIMRGGQVFICDIIKSLVDFNSLLDKVLQEELKYKRDPGFRVSTSYSQNLQPCHFFHGR